MKEAIKNQLASTITKTNFEGLGDKYEGKVRDSYIRDGIRYLITSDRLSCFDKVVTSVPFKGQVLNEMAIFWFDKTKDIISNHLIEAPDPNVMVVKDCELLPVEVVVRGYLTGSAWRDYQSGKDISGIRLPEGMKMSEKFSKILITPSTMAEKGAHDMPISEAEILSQNLVEKDLWEQVKKVSMSLFRVGQEHAKTQGLILVDTKYEFGLKDGKLILVDEIHTLDSSRFWIAAEYQSRFKQEEAQKMLDKEPTRQWLLSQGYKGDGPVPEFTDEHRAEISEHYISYFKFITGKSFAPSMGDPLERMKVNLSKYFK